MGEAPDGGVFREGSIHAPGMADSVPLIETKRA